MAVAAGAAAGGGRAGSKLVWIPKVSRLNGIGSEPEVPSLDPTWIWSF